MVYQENFHNYTLPQTNMPISNSVPVHPQSTSSPQGKKLLDQMRDALQTQHYSYRTENTYVEWAKRFVLFHKKRHPNEMDAAEIQAFITYLATERELLLLLRIRRSVPRFASSSIAKFFARKSTLSCCLLPNAPNGFLLFSLVKRRYVSSTASLEPIS